jgi:calcineurin-like phosphoesterase family protein
MRAWSTSVVRRTVVAVVQLSLAVAALAGTQGSPLPNAAGSLKFAVIGDNGTGSKEQYEVADQMARLHKQFPFDLVLMMGDNFYGSQRPADLEKKFGVPYKPLLDAGVKFQASLGNHDQIHTVNYAPIGMGGQRYYTFVRGSVRFFVLDTNALDQTQLTWLDNALQGAKETWKIAYFHHPLYGNGGRHGGDVQLRVRLEPYFLKYGVQIVFSGHDHVYERLTPQNGILYFVVGSSGQLRSGNLDRSDSTAAGFDRDRAFLACEIAGDKLYFQAISRTGATVDSGEYQRPARSGN